MITTLENATCQNHGGGSSSSGNVFWCQNITNFFFIFFNSELERNENFKLFFFSKVNGRFILLGTDNYIKRNITTKYLPVSTTVQILNC